MPFNIFSEDNFDFDKLADGKGDFIADWGNWGELFPGKVLESEPIVPLDFGLTRTFPNPFNPRTVISYELRDASFVELKVFDVMGREVESLVTGHLSLGYHEVLWNAEGRPSGVYFARLTVDGGGSMVMKVVLVK